MNNISSIKGRCSGCGACAIECPVDAIAIKMNNEGFYEAIVNNEKCINCGKCKKVCMKFSNSECLEIKNGNTIAAHTTDEEVLESTTSGGIAYEISKYGIDNGYYVVGTIYDSDFGIARATIADSYDEIEKYKGSKYLQSRVDETYKELIKKCKENADFKFIVFGTPCQIQGLSRVIENNNIQNKIIKVEVFCHGVPSYLFWNKYLNEIQQIDENNIKRVKFRDKTISWHEYYIEIEDKHGNKYTKCSDNDYFYKMFFDTVLLNEACQTCIYRKELSKADIRLGDFWGEKFKDTEKGISAVMIFNEDGKRIINELTEAKRINIVGRDLTQECIKYQSTDDYRYIELRKKSFENLKKYTTKRTIKLYRKKMSKKSQFKFFIQNSTRFIPEALRKKMRKIYKKM